MVALARMSPLALQMLGTPDGQPCLQPPAECPLGTANSCKPEFVHVGDLVNCCALLYIDVLERICANEPFAVGYGLRFS
jgi:hypothetical protein